MQLDQACLAQHSYLHRRQVRNLKRSRKVKRNNPNLRQIHILDELQLYALTLTSGCVLEAFFTPTGVLVVGVTTEKDFFTASVAGTPFTDANWHAILVGRELTW